MEYELKTTSEIWADFEPKFNHVLWRWLIRYGLSSKAHQMPLKATDLALLHYLSKQLSVVK